MRQGELLGKRSDTGWYAETLAVRRALQWQREAGLVFAEPKTAAATAIFTVTRKLSTRFALTKTSRYSTTATRQAGSGLAHLPLWRHDRRVRSATCEQRLPIASDALWQQAGLIERVQLSEPVDTSGGGCNLEPTNILADRDSALCLARGSSMAYCLPPPGRSPPPQH